MPKQNRVNPFGEIITSPARGSLMGNRGCLHNSRGQIQRLYQGKRWIFCQLQFKGRQRPLMTPGRYTELFFLDEATALAAGHRPCWECMRARFKMFQALWAQANPEYAGGPAPSAATIDAILHRERLKGVQKATYSDHLAHLPDGTFICSEPKGQPYLVFGPHLLAWSPEGYGQPIPKPTDRVVQVLTPRSVGRTLACGYRPAIHPSAWDIILE